MTTSPSCPTVAPPLQQPDTAASDSNPPAALAQTPEVAVEPEALAEVAAVVEEVVAQVVTQHEQEVQVQVQADREREAVARAVVAAILASVELNSSPPRQVSLPPPRTQLSVEEQAGVGSERALQQPRQQQLSPVASNPLPPSEAGQKESHENQLVITATPPAR